MQQAIDIGRELPEASPDTRLARAALLARLLAMASFVGLAINRRNEAVRAWADEAIGLARESGDRRILGLAISSRFLAAVFLGEQVPGELLALADDVVDIATEIGDWWTLGQAATAIGIHVADMDPEGADR